MRLLPLLLAAAVSFGCASDNVSSPNSLTKAEQSSGWKLLFDGSSLNGWEIYKKGTLPTGWKAADGVLGLEEKGAGDLATTAEYSDFELVYDWKISEAGNSGVMFRVTDQGKKPYDSGMEMQIIDNEKHPDGKKQSHRAGAAYDLVNPPDNIARPVGEWNRARLVAKGPHIEMWLNGVLTARLDLSSEEWSKQLAASKFSTWPYFAKSPRGRIVLQDHGDKVWFRNLKIRAL